jgi:hypothetical protein
MAHDRADRAAGKPQDVGAWPDGRTRSGFRDGGSIGRGWRGGSWISPDGPGSDKILTAALRWFLGEDVIHRTMRVVAEEHR